MIAVIFEVTPNAHLKQEYLDIAASLAPMLNDIDGFISIERFQSLANPEKVLSLSFWRDEAAVLEWRNMEAHRRAQSKGRTSIFQDYRIRIASVLRDYGMDERTQAPMDSQAMHG
ncbi:Aste57867_2634 [Aphanomyces stellatus]|uniref:Aste57867_2634 protein n=1 Tax=Aphanomyces stellatus TaxID=120398 RepID=A0A485KDP0_9STRA|nr:hypothetical protein As57867_002627 [Aphanomyces stellatus]VFT79830.1 Aste57867_2634 [Aphanomyces stellatus]